MRDLFYTFMVWYKEHLFTKNSYLNDENCKQCVPETKHIPNARKILQAQCCPHLLVSIKIDEDPQMTAKSRGVSRILSDRAINLKNSWYS